MNPEKLSLYSNKEDLLLEWRHSRARHSCLSIGPRHFARERRNSVPEALVSSFESTEFMFGRSCFEVRIQWVRKWNPVDSGQNLSFQKSNPVNSDLEALVSAAESSGFESGIHWIPILISMLPRLNEWILTLK